MLKKLKEKRARSRSRSLFNDTSSSSSCDVNSSNGHSLSLAPESQPIRQSLSTSAVAALTSSYTSISYPTVPAVSKGVTTPPETLDSRNKSTISTRTKSSEKVEDDGAENHSLKTENSSQVEVFECLESLKEVSLLALTSLVRKIVEQESSSVHNNTAVSLPKSTLLEIQNLSASKTADGNDVLAEMVEKRPLLTLDEPAVEVGDSKFLKSRENSELIHQASLISDGGQIIAALSQTNLNRSTSNDILQRSSESLHLHKEGLHDDLTSDHGLALALAALCNGLYQLLESDLFVQKDGNFDLVRALQGTEVPNIQLTPPQTSKMAKEKGHRQSNSTGLSNLVSTVAHVQNNRTLIGSEISPEQIQLWREIDQIMVLIQEICKQRQLNKNRESTSPPSYEDVMRNSSTVRPKLVKSDVKHVDQENLGLALNDVVDSIDRVMYYAPRLFNQTVTLSPRQERIMDAASLSNVVDRMSKGRFQDQRATHREGEKLERLNSLIEQISKAGERSLANQRVALSSDRIRQLEIAKIGKLVDRQDKLRMTNQDWESKEHRLIKDLTKLQNDLQKTNPSLANSQRYQLSAEKEKTLYMSGVAGKIGKMSERRMGNQDAIAPSERRAEDFEKIMDRMYASGSGMGDQRSPLSVRHMNSKA